MNTERDIASEMQDAVDYGYMPAATRKALKDGITHIATLEAQLTEARDALARRDAEIAGWLRALGALINARGVSGAIHYALADAIEAGAYKGATHE